MTRPHVALYFGPVVDETDQTITDRSRERNSCRKMVALIAAAYS